MEEYIHSECKSCTITMKNMKFLQRKHALKDGMCFDEGKNGNCKNYRP